MCTAPFATDQPLRRRSGIRFGLLVALLFPSAAGCGSFAASGLNAEGVRLFDQARYQEAVQQFQQALDNDPSNADAYYNLAAAYHRLGQINARASDLSQAESYYNLCLTRDPNHRECYRGFAVLLAEQNRSEEAFRLLQTWGDRNPADPEPKIELARLSEEFGDRESAKQYLADSLLRDPDNARALAALGRLREQTGDRLMALNNYQQSLYANRFQPEVAARVASLQSSSGSQALATSPSGGTRLVTQPGGPLR